MIALPYAQMKRENIEPRLDSSSVLALVERVTGNPRYAQVLSVEQIKGEQVGMDVYEIFDQGEGICIRATSGTAACAAFNWYLQERCGCFVGPLTKRLCLPERPPKVGGHRRVASPFLYRYFFNYCTFGYTTAFWKWEQYERLTDWMLLSGVNLVLNPIGHEAVWRDLLAELGYQKRQINDFLAGPLYLPWQWMLNMTGFGGDLPDWWYDDRVKLANRMNGKLQSFGVGIMAPGFCGMVPLDFEKHFPESSPFGQGEWCDFERPPLLLPEDPMYDRVADSFYRLTEHYFGKISYFSTDPFHEGGRVEGIDLPEYGRKTLAKMREHNPGAVWFLQGWQGNPHREMLQKLDKEHVLVANLSADESFDAGDDFGNSPWLYCTVNNFGGNRVISGNFGNSLRQPFRIDETPANNMVGIGLMMEAITMDEVFFDLFNHTAFAQACPTEEDYLSDFLLRRYGLVPENALRAWRILADDVYLRSGISAPRQSALCARPDLRVKNVSFWGSTEFNYDTEKLVEAARLLLSVYEECKESEGYLLDLTDVVRQCVANNGWHSLEQFSAAWTKGDADGFTRWSNRFLAHFDIQAEVLKTNRNTCLGDWLEEAWAYGKTESERRMFLFNAKALITVWGDKAGSTMLRDYAHREYAEMITDFYRPRWDSFIGLLHLYLNRPEELPQIDWFEAENQFALSGKRYPLNENGGLKEAAEKALAFLSEEAAYV